MNRVATRRCRTVNSRPGTATARQGLQQHGWIKFNATLQKQYARMSNFGPHHLVRNCFAKQDSAKVGTVGTHGTATRNGFNLDMRTNIQQVAILLDIRVHARNRPGGQCQERMDPCRVIAIRRSVLVVAAAAVFLGMIRVPKQRSVERQ